MDDYIIVKHTEIVVKREREVKSCFYAEVTEFTSPVSESVDSVRPLSGR